MNEPLKNTLNPEICLQLYISLKENIEAIFSKITDLNYVFVEPKADSNFILNYIKGNLKNNKKVQLIIKSENVQIKLTLIHIEKESEMIKGKNFIEFSGLKLKPLKPYVTQMYKNGKTEINTRFYIELALAITHGFPIYNFVAYNFE